MITATNLELRAGARTLLVPTSFRIASADRIGLVGRNGAGKTTLTRGLAGESQPVGGRVTRTGTVGYLPQDPRTGDLDVLATDRVLSARGLDRIVAELRATEGAMASADPDTHDRAMRRYTRLESEFLARGGYAAESEAAQIAACRIGRSASRWARCPVVSGAGWNWPESCSPAPRRYCWTSRQTTSTPTRSAGCASSSRSTAAGWS